MSVLVVAATAAIAALLLLLLLRCCFLASIYICVIYVFFIYERSSIVGRCKAHCTSIGGASPRCTRSLSSSGRNMVTKANVEKSIG